MMFNLFRKSQRHRQESAMGAAMLGCLLFIAGFPTLFLNEGRAVKTARALAEGTASVVSADASVIHKTNEGKLIHVSGEAKTEETVSDDEFGVSVNAIRLTRSVEMYQWKEVQQKVSRKVDGKTTTETEYDYEKVWANELLNAGEYHDPQNHTNPTEMRFKAKSWEASRVHLGQHHLSPELIAKITDAEPLAVDLSTVPASIADTIRIDGGTETSASGFYWFVNPESEEPEIGDVRIRFSVTRPSRVSVIAQQSGKTFEPFKTHSGRSLSMLSLGNVSAVEMFDQAEAENTAITWALRVVGSILLIVGIGLALQPLASITQWIPIVGKMVGVGTALVAVTLGGAFALLTISTAWLFYRPLVAIQMIVVSVGLLALLYRQSRSDSENNSQATAI